MTDSPRSYPPAVHPDAGVDETVGHVAVSGEAPTVPKMNASQASSAAPLCCVHAVIGQTLAAADQSLIPSAALHTPGAHLAVATRSPLSVGIGLRMRQQGWHVRDSIAWLRGDDPHPGWVILIGRAPLDGTVADTVTRYGTRALNIDAVRVGTADGFGGGAKASGGFVDGYEGGDGFVAFDKGRWPANTILTHRNNCTDSTGHLHCPANVIDEASGLSTSRKGNPRGTAKKGMFANSAFNAVGAEYDDTGGASRFYPQLAPGWTAMQDWLVRLLVAPGGTWLELDTGATHSTPALPITPAPGTPTNEQPDNTLEWPAERPAVIDPPLSSEQGALW